MKTDLITGVAGFLGRYVARHFVREGWRVIGIDDVPPENVQLTAVAFHRLQLPSTALPEILRATAPDVCVHCAGRASVPLSMAEPKPDFEANAVLTFELLDALRLHAPRCRLLFLSSAAVYGDPAALPVTEDQSVAPLSPYGYHKRQAELLCEEFSRIYGLPTAVVRIFSAYGPGLRRQVLWDICSRALMTGHLSLGGTGEESRDFIHAGDVAAGLRVLAERAAAEGEIYNLASGCETTIRELATLLLRALGSEITPQFDGQRRAGDPLHWRADISRLQALGFQPQISRERGIAATAQWCAAELSR